MVNMPATQSPAPTKNTLANRRPKACTKLGAMEDSSLQVRNTFIHGGLTRSPSLEDFYHEREVASCPGSRVGCLDTFFLEDDEATASDESATVSDRAGQSHDESATISDRTGQTDSATVTPVLTPRSWSGEPESGAQTILTWGTVSHGGPPPGPVPPAASALFDGQQLSWSVVVQPWVVERDLASQPFAGAHAFIPSAEPGPCQTSLQGLVGTGRTLVSLADSLLLGSGGGSDSAGNAGLASMGSALHDAGRCKPCAFVHSKGCTDGAMCQFCHLCEPGEKKRRQREKLKCRKAAYRLRKAASGDFC
jgi:hypothetical protein